MSRNQANTSRQIFYFLGTNQGNGSGSACPFSPSGARSFVACSRMKGGKTAGMGTSTVRIVSLASVLLLELTFCCFCRTDESNPPTDRILEDLLPVEHLLLGATLVYNAHRDNIPTNRLCK